MPLPGPSLPTRAAPDANIVVGQVPSAPVRASPVSPRAPCLCSGLRLVNNKHCLRVAAWLHVGAILLEPLLPSHLLLLLQIWIKLLSSPPPLLASRYDVWARPCGFSAPPTDGWGRWQPMAADGWTQAGHV